MMDDVEILTDIWMCWGELGSDLEDEEWSAPTRCEGWSVADVYAHASQGVSGLGALASDRVTGGRPDHPDAAAIMRSLKPAEEDAERLAEKNADIAVRDAREHTHAELIARFTDRAADVVAVARSAGSETVVDYFGHGTTTVGAAAHLRVVEGVVHLLDVADATGRDVDISDEALRRTADFLLDLTPLVDFIEVATGRSTADPFPVHS